MQFISKYESVLKLLLKIDNNLVLGGSYALYKLGLLSRQPNDLDILSDNEDLIDFLNEIEKISPTFIVINNLNLSDEIIKLEKDNLILRCKIGDITVCLFKKQNKKYTKINNLFYENILDNINIKKKYNREKDLEDLEEINNNIKNSVIKL
jgi:hypothetical protein